MLVSIVLLKGSIFAMMCLAKNLGIFFFYIKNMLEIKLLSYEKYFGEKLIHKSINFSLEYLRNMTYIKLILV
jgi:hypothetical protein